MKQKRIFKILLSIAIVLSLVFTPVFVSNSYLAFSYGTDDQVSDSQQLEVQQDDAANIQNVQSGSGAEGTADDQQEQRSGESGEPGENGDVTDVAAPDTEDSSKLRVRHSLMLLRRSGTGPIPFIWPILMRSISGQMRKV